MASIINANIDVTKIPKERLYEGKKGRYLTIGILVEDESKYGNNVGVIVGQTKEERESKEPRTYLGNGRVVWTDGKISVAERDEEPKSSPADDLYGEPDF